MENYTEFNPKRDNYFSSIKRQYNDIVNRPKIIAAYEKEAFNSKWKAISSKEKVKLILKKVALPFGIRKSLLLGSYRLEEDFRQRLQDMEVYEDILQSRIRHQKGEKIYSGKQHPIVKENTSPQTIDWAESFKTLLNDSKSYIALMVENLDSGGLEKVVSCLATWFCKNDIPVKVFCTRNGGKIERNLRNEGVDVLVFHGKKSLFNNYLKKNPPLLVNTHFVSDFYGIIHHYQIPIVEVIHNMYFFLTDKQLKQEQKKQQYITHYIAVSEAAKEVFYYKVSQITNDKITVIGNSGAIEKDALHLCNSPKEKMGFSEDTFIFLAVGSIDARKNQIGIVRAFDIVKSLITAPLVLILAGAITDYEYSEKINMIIAERNLQNDIIFWGYTENIVDIMNASDALIVNSYYEGWSMAATEALHCGLPLIHSKCGSGKELIANGQNGILIDNPIENIISLSSIELYDKMHMGINENISQLAAAMINMFENKETWKMHREKVKKYAQENFTQSNMMQEYLHVYDETYHKFMAN